MYSEVVDTNGSGHGALAGVLNALNADVLICGGIGGGAQTALAAAGIKLFGGVSGDADKAVEDFINDTLDYIIIQMLSVFTMSTATERDIHVVNMDVETIAVIKKNRKKYNTKGCVKVMGELS